MIILVTSNNKKCINGIFVAPLRKNEAKMVYGIPLFGNRVAPRCTIANSVLLLKENFGEVLDINQVKIKEKPWINLLKYLSGQHVDVLVCGGISFDERKLAVEFGISIIDNVACSDREIINAIKNGNLKPGYGFSDTANLTSSHLDKTVEDDEKKLLQSIDCLLCSDQMCLQGKKCSYCLDSSVTESKRTKKILEIATDISTETERSLCRLSELVYFAIEMDYKNIGIAYCIELSEPAAIVTQVLRRFFNIFPVCCKAGGKFVINNTGFETSKIACNPKVQADILNNIGVDFNIIIGLCIGADCIFSEFSKAPVSTLFVKDRSLANNPIGAVYLDYYLEEATNKTFITS